MSYEELNIKTEESEILSHEHEKVRGMCGGLKRVNAPKNFDFHLKARIANCDKSDFQQNAFLPFLRYAVPLCVVLLLAGFVVFSGILTGNQSTDATLVQNLQPNEKANPATTMLEKTEAKVTETTPTVMNSNVVLASANAESPKPASNVQAAQSANKTELASSANKNLLIGEDFGGTRTSSSKDSRVINPPGTSPKPNSATITPPNMGNSNRSSIKEVLKNFGIEADFVNSGWRVKSISVNSLASRAGIKTGDLLEATDSLKLNTEMINEQSFEIKSFQLIREGKKIIVELR